MFNVLIVDDEKSNREGMRYLIEWETYGFCINDTVANGVQALKVIEEREIDLVIVDIKMPIMNGIELITKVREAGYDQIEFIILSGYAEFDYVKKAMHLGVKDYLLKPIEEEELCELLNQLNKKFQLRKKDKQKEKRSKLEALLEDKQEEIEDINQYFPQGDYYYSKIKLEEEKDKEEEVIQLIVEELGEECRGYIVKEREGVYGLVIGRELLNKYRGSIKELSEELYTLLNVKHAYPCSILIGDKVADLRNLYLSKKSIEVCKLHLFYEGPCTIINYEMVKTYKIASEFKEDTYTAQLYHEIEDNNELGIQNEIYKLCRAFKDIRLDMVHVKILVHYIIVSVLKQIGKCGEESEEVLEKYRKLSSIESDTTLKYVQEELTMFCLLAAASTIKDKKRKNMGVMGEILSYVDLNYTENLNLKGIANKYYLNASYLGQLFKKTTGVSFKSYLQSIRIRESKMLLRTSNLKIYEIAHKVGYEDANYFVIKFEESEGVSPTTYRKNKQYD